jgi:hypothetical protein
VSNFKGAPRVQKKSGKKESERVFKIDSGGLCDVTEGRI